MLSFFSSRRRHTRWTGDWRSDVCSSDLSAVQLAKQLTRIGRTGPYAGDPIAIRTVIREAAAIMYTLLPRTRSEERRVGKECRSGRWAMPNNENTKEAAVARLLCLLKTVL